MSRSYRHTPITKDNRRGVRNNKRIVAQRLRAIPVESEESEILIASRSSYKKINHDTWDIHDYISRWTREDAIREYHEAEANNETRILNLYPTLEDFLLEWEKCMLHK